MSIGNVDLQQGKASQVKSSQIKIRNNGNHNTEWEIRKMRSYQMRRKIGRKTRKDKKR